jgi:hypothetical protein
VQRTISDTEGRRSLRGVASKNCTIATGFGVVRAAVSYTERCWSQDRGQTHRWNGGLALRTTWQGEMTNLVNTGAWWYAREGHPHRLPMA